MRKILLAGPLRRPLRHDIVSPRERVASLPPPALTNVVSLAHRARLGKLVLDASLTPGAEPKDLAENLIAVLAERAENEPDPVRKRRLVQVGETVKELGMSLTSGVLAKVITGGV